jgi:hypothetical protein
VADSCEYGDEPSGSGDTELVKSLVESSVVGDAGCVGPSGSATRRCAISARLMLLRCDCHWCLCL